MHREQIYVCGHISKPAVKGFAGALNCTRKSAAHHVQKVPAREHPAPVVPHNAARINEHMRGKTGDVILCMLFPGADDLVITHVIRFHSFRSCRTAVEQQRDKNKIRITPDGIGHAVEQGQFGNTARTAQRPEIKYHGFAAQRFEVPGFSFYIGNRKIRRKCIHQARRFFGHCFLRHQSMCSEQENYQYPQPA